MLYETRTTEAEQERERGRRRREEEGGGPAKACKINGTFMRYRMTHQIHLAAKALTAGPYPPPAWPHPLHIQPGWDRPASTQTRRLQAWPRLWHSLGTHLHLPLGQPLLSGPLANVVGVASLESDPGNGPLPQADLPALSPS